MPASTATQRPSGDQVVQGVGLERYSVLDYIIVVEADLKFNLCRGSSIIKVLVMNVARMYTRMCCLSRLGHSKECPHYISNKHLLPPGGVCHGCRQ